MFTNIIVYQICHGNPAITKVKLMWSLEIAEDYEIQSSNFDFEKYIYISIKMIMMKKTQNGTILYQMGSWNIVLGFLVEVLLAFKMKKL